MTRFDRDSLAPTVLVALAALPAAPAGATVYATADAAGRALFPQAQSFEALTLTFTAEQRQQIEKMAGRQAGHGQLRCWAARSNGVLIGHVFVDEVIGRQDFITYAVGIDATGKLRPVEILE